MTDAPDFKQDNSLSQEEYLKCKAVYGGSPYVAGYLLKPVSESTAEHDIRKKISSIDSTYKKGINSFRDIIFRKDIEYSDDIPEQLLEYYKTVSGGDNLNSLSRDTLKDILLANDCYWLIWTPQFQAANAKEEEEIGLRPYIEKITADRIVDSLTYQDALGNLTMVTVQGSYVYEKNRYEKKTKTEFRVYFKDGLVEIWRQDSQNVFTLVDEVQSEVKAMPIIKMTFSEGESIPPFVNEANLQLQQYNIESAKFSYNIKLAFPLVVTWGMLMNSHNIATDGFDDEGNEVKLVEFQSSKGIDFPVNPETGSKLGDIEFKEVSGTSDKVLKSTSEDLTKSIIDGFITMTTDASGNKTVEQAESERVAGESTLAATASNLELFINRGHDLFSQFAGIPTKGYITINKQFVKDMLDELEYKLLIDLLGEEIIDKREFVLELQRYGKVKNIDVDELMDRLTAVGK